mmetsp:Transcript_34365/g.114750  ORF Transcript_34365/g.114750 Transcript_34365/m.114750 type:complete len:260 (+) Transcript_34365:134-913(+)
MDSGTGAFGAGPPNEDEREAAETRSAFSPGTASRRAVISSSTTSVPRSGPPPPPGRAVAPKNAVCSPPPPPPSPVLAARTAGTPRRGRCVRGLPAGEEQQKMRKAVRRAHAAAGSASVSADRRRLHSLGLRSHHVRSAPCARTPSKPSRRAAAAAGAMQVASAAQAAAKWNMPDPPPGSPTRRTHRDAGSPPSPSGPAGGAVHSTWRGGLRIRMSRRRRQVPLYRSQLSSFHVLSSSSSGGQSNSELTPAMLASSMRHT